MDDDPDFNTGYDAMIADTYKSDFPEWFERLQNGDYDQDDWYILDYYSEIYRDTMINFWDYPIDCIDEVEEEEPPPPEDDPDFNTGYDAEEEPPIQDDDPDFNAAYDVILSLPDRDYENRRRYFFPTKATNPNRTVRKGCSTALLCAIPDITMVRKLLAHPNINVNKASAYRGQSEVTLGGPSQYPLLLAIYTGNIKVIKALLKVPGIKLDISDEYGMTPLGAAFDSKREKYPRKEIVDLLMNTEGISRSFTFLQENSRFCRRPPEIAGGVVAIETKSYLDGKEVHYTSGINLFQAIRQQNIQEIIRLLQDPMIDINCIIADYAGTGTFPLAEAVRTDNIEIVKLLLAHPRIDVNNKLACETDWNYFHDIQFIVPTGETALHTAVQQRSLRMVSLLLTHPAVDVNQGMVKTKKTPLMLACSNSLVDIVKRLLLEPTININQKNYKGNSALIYTGTIDFVPDVNIRSIEEIQRMLLVHPKMERSASRQLLSKWLLQNDDIIKVLCPDFIKYILQLETDNPKRLRTAQYNALIRAIEQSSPHIKIFKPFHVKKDRLLRLAIAKCSPNAIKFIMKGMTVKSLKKTLEWTCCKNYKEYERFNSDAVNILSERIQLLGELRSLTEMDLFATHLPLLPVDVQRVIGKMLCAKS